MEMLDSRRAPNAAPSPDSLPPGFLPKKVSRIPFRFLFLGPEQTSFKAAEAAVTGARAARRTSGESDPPGSSRACPRPVRPALTLPPQVEATSRKEKAAQRPLALNTVEMLRVASSALGKCGLFLSGPHDLKHRLPGCRKAWLSPGKGRPCLESHAGHLRLPCWGVWPWPAGTGLPGA